MCKTINSRSIDVVKALQDCGVSPKYKDEDGVTLLQHAGGDWNPAFIKKSGWRYNNENVQIEKLLLSPGAR